MLARQFVLRRESARTVAEVMGSKPCGRGHDELVSKEIQRAVRDLRGEFPTKRAISMVMPANGSFSGVLLFPFYFLLLDHFSEAR